MSESTALTTYQKVDNPIAFSNEMGAAFASLCGCNPDQGKGLALAALCEGMTPMEFSRRYHWIKGRPSMQSAAMLAEFRNHGGKHEIIESSADRAAIKLTDKHGTVYEHEFTWEEAQQSRWPWIDWKNHDKGLKDNWATPTDRRAMLWARCVKEAVNKAAPEIAYGIYTPEEVMDLDDAPSQNGAPPTAAEIVARQQEPATVETVHVTETKQADMDAVQEPAPKEEAAKAEEPADQVAAGEPPREAAPETEVNLDAPIDRPQIATPAQVRLIEKLYDQVGVSDKSKQQALETRGISSLAELTREDADIIIDKLQAAAESIGGN